MEQANQQLNEVSLFIQKNYKFYEKKFRKMEETGRSISWNWSAFFMGIYWMIYRKMYFKAGAFFILSLVASSTPYIGDILNVAVLVGIGMYANALYLDHIEGHIERVERLYPNEKYETINKIGGTNLPSAIIIYGIQIIAIIFVVFLKM